MNVGRLLTNTVGKKSNHIAIIFENRSWTFKELNERVNRMCNVLMKMGVQKNDRVALMFFNSIHFVESYFAAIKIGAIVVPVNFRFVGREIEYVINDSGAKVFLFGEEFHEVISQIRSDLSGVVAFITVNSQDRSAMLDYEELIGAERAIEPNVDIKEEDPCQILYTSGTTGRPKGAVLTNENILWSLVNTIIGREEKPGEIALIIGPLYHVAGLNIHLTTQIALGGTSILIKKFDPIQVLEIIQREHATTISGAPSMYRMLLQHLEAHSFDVSSITKCTVGAAILSTETKKQLEKYFPNIKGIYDVYGSTEVGIASILQAEDSWLKEGSVGKPMPFVQVKIVDEQDRPLDAGMVGELVCCGPNVMVGYNGEEEETRLAFKGGWFHTGDLARMDEEGYIYIVDRKKDMIVSGGENIYPREIEEILYMHPSIIDAAVVGIEDPLWGESVRAFVVKKEGESLKEDDVVNYCKQHLASYKKPKVVVFIEEIPRNPSGKILKNKLRKISV